MGRRTSISNYYHSAPYRLRKTSQEPPPIEIMQREPDWVVEKAEAPKRCCFWPFGNWALGYHTFILFSGRNHYEIQVYTFFTLVT